MADIDLRLDGVDLPVAAVLADARAAVQALGLVDAELSLVLCDDAFILPLNQQWRGVDAATDVLSFPQQEGTVQGGVLGDIVISVDTARRQSAALGHDLDAELRVLLVHGLLHLLGHDHLQADESARMRGAESDLLAALSSDSSAPLLSREDP